MHATAGDLFDRADNWSRIFRILGDPTRLRLLTLMHWLGPEAATVSELALKADLKLATASAALRSMENSGIISGDRVGREVRYALVDPDVHEVLHHVGFTHASD